VPPLLLQFYHCFVYINIYFILIYWSCRIFKFHQIWQCVSPGPLEHTHRGWSRLEGWFWKYVKTHTHPHTVFIVRFKLCLVSHQVIVDVMNYLQRHYNKLKWGCSSSHSSAWKRLQWTNLHDKDRHSRHNLSHSFTLVSIIVGFVLSL